MLKDEQLRFAERALTLNTRTLPSSGMVPAQLLTTGVHRMFRTISNGAQPLPGEFARGGLSRRAPSGR